VHCNYLFIKFVCPTYKLHLNGVRTDKENFNKCMRIANAEDKPILNFVY